MDLSDTSAGTHVSDRNGSIIDEFRRVRAESEALCAPLEIEDYGIQTMPDVSPPKWHLAHVSWFFETFVLKPFARDYAEFRPKFAQLFNSYYETVGSYHPRPERGLLARPTVAEVFAYRRHVDEAVMRLLTDPPAPCAEEIRRRVRLGLNHEQQHQELLVTDIKHIFAYNPLRPVYHAGRAPRRAAPKPDWIGFPSGLYEIGHAGDGFGFDNEFPRHRVFVQAFLLASRPVSNAEYLAFMEAGGYRRAELWLSAGWKQVRDAGWDRPLYWEHAAGGWEHMTLAGWTPLDPDAPVCHLSYFEADAYARWCGKRLPTEMEWEVAAARLPVQGNFAASGWLQPAAAARSGLAQMYGDVWEWTSSAYAAYPGYRPPGGALGEYNGKFMCGQFVLRGGSCATPDGHVRASYRNFFYPHDRWQFSGLRLADDF
ncbi:MAG: ergothioneine biosynthesis protein EgtB [Gammaproteobacteria bacterium]|nr:ergothioneine biosynthesis protein EgtB [Gammaproteobacteria bacterium]